MIPKPGKSDYSDPSAWRPITITSAVYRLLMKYLTWELYNWIILNQMLSRSQKSLGKFEGCHDHNAMLNMIIQDVRRQTNPTCPVNKDKKTVYSFPRFHECFRVGSFRHINVRPSTLWLRHICSNTDQKPLH